MIPLIKNAKDSVGQDASEMERDFFDYNSCNFTCAVVQGEDSGLSFFYTHFQILCSYVNKSLYV